ncbi:ABC transporter ATP-binding protein [Egbenema bharatensis]|uniref:ABC transporter ATP-binding protein n=1 Tax=Egbenema bharatensis TaxID=3463334 RepID=UPI003A85B768
MTTTTPISTAETLIAPPELEVINLTKRFGTFTALDRVSMKVAPGRFHALLGENGAGKSTLVKCIMGFYTPTSGDVLIGKQSRTIANPKDAHHFGIGMVYQHFTSVPAMTVAENLVLSRYDSPQLINWKAELESLEAFMSQSPFQVDLHTPIAQLAAGQKQKLEILKQLYLKSRVLILDEPTSVLTPVEADEVLGLLRQEVTAGRLSVLMISHKFREVMAFADEVTVLRRGQLAGSGLVQDLTIEDMAQMMLGERQVSTPVEKAIVPEPRSVLHLQNLCANKDNGLPAVKTVNLTVHAGEIVGIAGVSGNGQRELVEVLSGQRSPTAGEVQVNETPYQARRSQMAEHGVYTLPEEPLRNACVPHMSVAENMALRTFDEPPQAKARWLLIPRAIREMAQRLVQTFAVKTPSVETPVGNLSGGNVQRTVLARELSSDRIQLLIAANPCFGLDFAAVDYIHSQIVAARNRGVAVLLVSEDLDELLKLSDRIFVMSEGELVYESPVETADLTTIGQRMAGH